MPEDDIENGVHSQLGCSNPEYLPPLWPAFLVDPGPGASPGTDIFEHKVNPANSIGSVSNNSREEPVRHYITTVVENGVPHLLQCPVQSHYSNLSY